MTYLFLFWRFFPSFCHAYKSLHRYGERHSKDTQERLENVVANCSVIKHLFILNLISKYDYYSSIKFCEIKKVEKSGPYFRPWNTIEIALKSWDNFNVESLHLYDGDWTFLQMCMNRCYEFCMIYYVERGSELCCESGHTIKIF